jgi:hypothetical protein
MRTRRFPLAGLVVLTMLAGGQIYGAQAQAAVGHPFLEQLTGFNAPVGVAADAGGDIYVADSGSETVQKLNATGTPTSFSGSASYINASKLTGTPSGVFGNLTGVAVAASGDIYVLDAGDGTVDIFDPSGVYQGKLTEADGVTPYPASEGSDIAISPATGAIYMSGQFSAAILEFNSSGVYQRTIGVPDIHYFESLAIDDSTGDLYAAISFEPNRVYVQEASGNVLATWTGSNTPAGGWGECGCKNEFAYVAADDSSSVGEGEVFVGSNKAKVVDIFDESGGYLAQLAGGPSGTAFSSPGQLSVDPNGHLYVIDGSTVDVFGVGVVPDVVTSGEASAVTSTSATVSGTINPVGGLDASYQFEYGLTAGYGESTTPVDVGSATLPAPGESVSANLTGLRPNATYHYRLTGTNTNGAGDGPDQTFTTVPALATVNDQRPSASSVTHTSMTLSATLNPENAPTFYHFIYGTTSSYGSAGPELEGGAGYGDEPVGQFIGGLEPNTTYHYALVATNKAGTITGPDETFTTSALTPPTLSTGAVENITQTSATLTGAVDTEGEITTIYGFDLGTDTDYTQAFVVGHTEAGEPSPGTIAQTVGGLEPGTTYHYRLFATNTDGTTHSSDGTFTTAGPPNPSTVLDILTVPTSTPLLSYVPNVAFPAETKTATVKKKTVKKKSVKAKKKTAKHKAKKHKAKKSSGTR